MKLLTLNTHSLVEPDYEAKRKFFVDFITKEQPDVFALQEVNQTASAPAMPIPLADYCPCSGNRILLKEDNHAAAVAQMLKEEGVHYYWSWLPAKIGYDKYDEGMAIFSRMPITATENLLLSRTDDYHYWKTRRALGICAGDVWYYAVHMGWWKDEEEPFKAQWETFLKNTKSLMEKKETSLWVMGDFNSPASVRGEGYDLVRVGGFKDTWDLAEKKDAGFTAPPKIDGWKEAEGKSPEQGMRIDYIWHWGDINIEESRVLCNGKREPAVSDHYAVMIKTGI